MTLPAGLTPASGTEIAQALDRAGRDNPLLGLATGPIPDALPATGLCRPAGSTTDDHGAAAALVDAVGTWLGTGERRVAASMVVLGYAARLVGPAVAVLLRDRLLVDLRPAQVRYAYRPDRGFRLATPQPAGWGGPPTALRHLWCQHVVDAHLRPVIDTMRRVAPVAAALLWGNVASGLAGALRTVSQPGGVPAKRCYATGLALLAHGPLRGSGHLTLHNGQLRFARRSCCLYYRLDGGGTCGDCPLPTTAARYRGGLGGS